MFFIIFCSFAMAQSIPGESIYTNTKPLETGSGKTNKESIKIQRDSGNLPSEYRRHLARESNNSKIVLPPNTSSETYNGIKVGDSIKVSVNHSVIAFPDESTPVVATGSTGAFKNLKFIGQSKLEKNTKRIFIEFQKVVIGGNVFHTKGVGISASGQPGLIGEYHSRAAEYFTGDFISSFAAGYFDGLVPRYTNIFGQTETDSSVDTAVKKGLASGALSSAERFKEKLKRVPEFSELKGPTDIEILFLEKVATKN